MEKEKWAYCSINGYGQYSVSNLGRVKNNKTGKILKPFKRGGYLSVTLVSRGDEKQIFVHRLVANEFIFNTHNEPQVNHIDGNKLNNAVSNLEWCTDKANKAHAKAKGLYNNRGKNTKECVAYLRSLGFTYSKISETLGVVEPVVYNHLKSLDKERINQYRLLKSLAI